MDIREDFAKNKPAINPMQPYNNIQVWVAIIKYG